MKKLLRILHHHHAAVDYVGLFSALISPFSNGLCPLCLGPPLPAGLPVDIPLSKPNSMSGSLGRKAGFCIGFGCWWRRRLQSLPRTQAIADTTTITPRTIKTVPNDPLEWEGGCLVTVLG
ncbi:hypothetical protein PVL29_000759 [Vitis rotundifolia]|uniref:Uncharacterized protein n=1 Tax=Vitis rotundifolia TaxID=103349 RepID=A0AA39E568_VITRO|nr:hypothetical protein PVL29_000759 [Vitis rotundifolia]